MNLTFTLIDAAAISPFLILLGFALIILLFESFSTQASRKYSFYLALVGIIASIFAALYAPASENPLLTPWLRFDTLAKFFTIFFLLIGLATTLLSKSFFKKFEATRGEYYFLLLSAIFGLILIGDSADFLSLFLGIETLSISLYVLCCYMRRWEISQESAIKYFLMGSLAAAFILYGIALIYGAVGTTGFDGLLSGYKGIQSDTQKTLFLSGIALVTLGLAFEAAIVPFHIWAPDVYDGAPNPVTAFMAVGTKAGAFAAFIRVFMDALPNFNPIWNEGIALLAYPTLIYANIVAMRQVQLRRFFAYSGIANAGYLFIPLAAGTSEALPAILFYLVIYALATLGSFAVLAFLDHSSEGVMLKDLRGLFKRSPFLAGILMLCLLTLAGIPPTAGFFAKFYLFKVAFQAGYYALVIVGLLATILAVYYYLRIVGTMFSDAEERVPTQRTWSASLVGVVAVLAIIFVSCYPAPLLNLLAFVAK